MAYQCVSIDINHCKNSLKLFVSSPHCFFWSVSSFTDPTVNETIRYVYVNVSESVSCSVMPNSATPWTVALQASLSMEFSRQEYWSGWPFPSPRDLPNPGIKPRSPALQQILYHLSHQYTLNFAVWKVPSHNLSHWPSMEVIIIPSLQMNPQRTGEVTCRSKCHNQDST